MAAATAVFATAELSEMILLHLPMRDLLRVQRVDKDINAVISGSKALRRKLFFESAPGGPLTHFLNRNGTISSYSSGERAIYKKRVRNLPEGMEEAMKFDEMWHKGKDAPGVPVPVELNPVFTYAMQEVERAMMAGNFTQASLPSSWRRPEASWRRMKMTQPSTEFTLFIHYQSVRVSKSAATLPVRPDTDLGQLVDTIYERPYIDSIKKIGQIIHQEGHFAEHSFRTGVFLPMGLGQMEELEGRNGTLENKSTQTHRHQIRLNEYPQTVIGIESTGEDTCHGGSTKRLRRGK